jgi:hypothetical protein
MFFRGRRGHPNCREIGGQRNKAGVVQTEEHVAKRPAANDHCSTQFLVILAHWSKGAYDYPRVTSLDHYSLGPGGGIYAAPNRPYAPREHDKEMDQSAEWLNGLLKTDGRAGLKLDDRRLFRRQPNHFDSTSQFLGQPVFDFARVDATKDLKCKPSAYDAGSVRKKKHTLEAKPETASYVPGSRPDALV